MLSWMSSSMGLFERYGSGISVSQPRPSAFSAIHAWVPVEQ